MKPIMPQPGLQSFKQRMKISSTASAHIGGRCLALYVPCPLIVREMGYGIWAQRGFPCSVQKAVRPFPGLRQNRKDQETSVDLANVLLSTTALKTEKILTTAQELRVYLGAYTATVHIKILWVLWLGRNSRVYCGLYFRIPRRKLRRAVAAEQRKVLLNAR